MKNYPKTYEDVFTSERSLKKCDIEKVSTDLSMEIGEYIDTVANSVRESEKEMWDCYVKTYWLLKHFCYDGIRRKKVRWNGKKYDGAFSVFMRHYVGIEPRFLTRNTNYSVVSSYFEEMFPNFEVRNPFKEKMSYPYKYITLGFLMVVARMKERMDILDYADKRKMRYTDFLDYVINYVNCYNDDIGKNHYLFDFTFGEYLPYVRVVHN